VPKLGYRTDAEATIGAAGDLLPMEDDHLLGSDPFEPIRKDLFDTDISFANLEAPIGFETTASLPVEGSGPQLRFSINGYRDVRGRVNGFKVLSVANNHALDLGFDGFESTINQLRKDGVIAVGLRTESPCITDVNGVRVGWIGLTTCLNRRPSDAELPIELLTCRSDWRKETFQTLSERVARYRRAACDIVVVSSHWGVEFECVPTAAQRALAETLVASGVDLVLGHHPHVIQPIEWIKNRTDRLIPVFYSLGSLTSRVNVPSWTLSMLARVRVSVGQRGGRRMCFVSRVEAIPVVRLHWLRTSGERQAKIFRLSTAVEAPLHCRHKHTIRHATTAADRILGPTWRDAPMTARSNCCEA
jgi:poly-gamma-glutamate synthesis protein (capsule biosynthesis protein)